MQCRNPNELQYGLLFFFSSPFLGERLPGIRDSTGLAVDEDSGEIKLGRRISASALVPKLDNEVLSLALSSVGARFGKLQLQAKRLMMAGLSGPS